MAPRQGRPSYHSFLGSCDPQHRQFDQNATNLQVRTGFNGPARKAIDEGSRYRREPGGGAVPSPAGALSKPTPDRRRPPIPRRRHSPSPASPFGLPYNPPRGGGP